MKEPSRRSLIKNAAKVAAAVTGGSMLTRGATAQTTGKLEKKGYPASQPGKNSSFQAPFPMAIFSFFPAWVLILKARLKSTLSMSSTNYRRTLPALDRLWRRCSR